MSKTLSANQIWMWPIQLGVITIIGLFSALAGDDEYDIVSWVMLSIPLVTVIFYSFRKR